ncbi:unnamed protein product [Phyllotreta striolata]|uniref:Uncharacterized protein n=1 Tax=Phyllotreta striolata TaxID=444603 RepID=A0A9N9TGA3_PHYSR|nr:unnamed protein product [Phyllotreta striolata]
MEPKRKLQYSVTFDDKSLSTDSAEVTVSDDDQTPAFTKTATNSSALRGEGGDMNSESTISTSILDELEEVKLLRRKVNELEAKNKLLDYQVEKVNTYLVHEKTKNCKLEKKLQFVRDNQDVFMKLKEAYVNMRYNQAAGRKMIELREKSQQTWDGILCRACIGAEQMRRQLEAVKETYKGSYIIKPFQLEKLLSTVKCLKDQIDKREQSWSLNVERDLQLRTQIETLESENSLLRDLLKNRDAFPSDDTFSSDKTSSSELALFKKIIIKYEKKIRELQLNNNNPVKLSISFDDKERRIIAQLMAKYVMRKRRKYWDMKRCGSFENKSGVCINNA